MTNSLLEKNLPCNGKLELDQYQVGRAADQVASGEVNCKDGCCCSKLSSRSNNSFFDGADYFRSTMNEGLEGRQGRLWPWCLARWPGKYWPQCKRMETGAHTQQENRHPVAVVWRVNDAGPPSGEETVCGPIDRLWSNQSWPWRDTIRVES